MDLNDKLPPPFSASSCSGLLAAAQKWRDAGMESEAVKCEMLATQYERLLAGEPRFESDYEKVRFILFCAARSCANHERTTDGR